MLRYEGAYSTDSVFYVDAARWIAAGHGPRSGIGTAAEVIQDGALPPRPLRMWPPGYPYLAAAVMALGCEAPQAALIAVQIGAAILLAAAALLGYALAGANGAALALAACAIHPALRLAAVHAWSETPAMALLLAAFAAAAFAVRRGGLALAAAAGALAVLALTFRYALAPASAAVCACYLLAHRKRLGLRLTAAHAGAFVLTLALVWAVTRWRPGGAGPRMRDAWLNPGGQAYLLAEQILGSLRPGSATVSAIYAALIGACIVAWLRRRRTQAPGVGPVPGASLLILWPPIYGAALLAGAVRYHLDPIDARLSLPLSLPLAIGLAIALSYGARLYRWLPIAAASLLIAGAAYGEWRALAPVLRTPPPAPYETARRIARSETLQWLQADWKPGDRVMTIDGLDVPFLLGTVPTILSITGERGASAAESAAFAELLRRETGGGRFLLVLRGRFREDEPLPIPPVLGGLDVESADARRFDDGAVLIWTPQ